MGQRKVLVVDDDPHVCRVASYTLQKAGYSASVAYSAEEAAAALATGEPDLVLLDIGLPDGDGCSVCGQLKAYGTWPRVIILTGHSSVNDAERANAAGADEYMTKPFSPSVLLSAVKRLLSGRRRPSSRPPGQVR